MSDALDVTITLEDVFGVIQGKRVPLAPELAGYLALAIAEGADPQGGDVDPKAVYIAEEGTVALVKPKREITTGSAETSIRAILARLLEASGSQTPALAAASRRKSTGNLKALVLELEAALIPVNRAAGRRALARLAREAKRVTLGVGRNAQAPPSTRGPSSSQPNPRATESAPRLPASSSHPVEEPTTAKREVGPEVMKSATPRPRPVEPRPPPSPPPKPDVARPSSRPPPSADVDNLLAQFEVSSQRTDRAVARDLKAMVGLDPTPPPPGADRPPSGPPGAADASVESLLAMSEPIAAPAVLAPAPPVSQRGAAKAALPPLSPAARAAALGPSTASVKTAPEPSPGRARSPEPRPRKKGGDRTLVVILVLLLLAAAGAALTVKLPPGFFSGRTAEKVAQEKASAEAARAKAAALQQVASCKAALDVVDVPTNAEVLLREGQAPIDVERMPVGARLEFVATAEGYAPRRTVVPRGAAWDPAADGRPRFEVAVQLDKSAKPKGDLWPAGEPGSEVGGQGAPGTVHIVSTPRGAEVWLLAGLGPEAKMEQLPCDTDMDVLVAGPTTLRKRLHVEASAFVSDSTAGAHRLARISAK